MRQAGKDYKTYKTPQKPDSAIPKSIVIMNSQDDEDNKADVIDEEHSEMNNQGDILIDDTSTKNEDLSSRDTLEPTSIESENSKDEEEDEPEKENKSDTTQDEDNQGFYDYFFFTKLFA